MKNQLLFFCFFLIGISIHAQDCTVPDNISESDFLDPLGKNCFGWHTFTSYEDFRSIQISNNFLGISKDSLMNTNEDDPGVNFWKTMSLGFGDKSEKDILDCLDYLCSKEHDSLKNQAVDLGNIISGGLSSTDIDSAYQGKKDSVDGILGTDLNSFLQNMGGTISNLNLDSILIDILGINPCSGQLNNPNNTNNNIFRGGGRQQKIDLNTAFEEAFKALNIGNESVGFSGDPNWFLGQSEGLGAISNHTKNPVETISKQAKNNVDLYNGKSNFNYNLTSIGSKDVNFPVGVSTTPGGLKVNDTEGLLGSNLNISQPGSITREVRGIPDDFKGEILGNIYGYKQAVRPVLELYGAGLKLSIAGEDQLGPVEKLLLEKVFCSAFNKLLAEQFNNSIDTQLPDIQNIIDSLKQIYPSQEGTTVEKKLKKISDKIDKYLYHQWEKEVKKVKVTIQFDWKTLTPNFINAMITINIPINAFFSLDIQIGVRFGLNIIKIPTDVILVDSVYGYNYVQDPEVINKFNIPRALCNLNSEDSKNAVKYLYKSKTANKRTDEDFFKSKWHRFFDFFKNIKEAFTKDYHAPRYKSSRLDFEQDIYHYNVGGYSGKFVLSPYEKSGTTNLINGKSIIFSPYQDIQTTIKTSNGQIDEFIMKLPNGQVHTINVKGSKLNNQYNLPMFMNYPEIAKQRQDFKKPILAKTEYPISSFIGGIPFYRKVLKDYLTNYSIQHGPEYTHVWKVKKIESVLTKEKIVFDYHVRNKSHNSSKNWTHSFPNFAPNRNEFFLTKKNTMLNGHNFNTEWQNGFSELNYSIVESYSKEPVIKNISNNRNVNILYKYSEVENSAFEGDTLLHSVIEFRKGKRYKTWVFKYDQKDCLPEGGLVTSCDSSSTANAAEYGLPAFNSINDELRFKVDVAPNDYLNERTFFQPLSISVLCFRITFPIRFTTNIERKPLSNYYFAHSIGEYSSLVDLKKKLNLLDGLEYKRYKSEYIRNFVKSIDEIGLKSEQNELLRIQRVDGTETIPKRFSLHQDVMGYYTINSSANPFFKAEYVDVFGGKESTNTPHMSFVATGNLSPNATIFKEGRSKSNLAKKVAQIDSIVFETGAYFKYNFDHHNFPEKTNNYNFVKINKVGLRTKSVVQGSLSASAKKTRFFKYENPSLVNFPMFSYQNRHDTYVGNIEQRVINSWQPTNTWYINKNDNIGYSKVIEYFSIDENFDPNVDGSKADHGRIEYDFSHPEDLISQGKLNAVLPKYYSIINNRPLQLNLEQYEIFQHEHSIFNELCRDAYKYEDKNWRLGRLKTKKIFGSNGLLVQENNLYADVDMIKSVCKPTQRSINYYQDHNYQSVNSLAVAGGLHQLVDGLTALSKNILIQYLRFIIRAFNPIDLNKHIERHYIVSEVPIYSEAVQHTKSTTTYKFENGDNVVQTINTYNDKHPNRIDLTTVTSPNRTTTSQTFYPDNTPSYSFLDNTVLNELKNANCQIPIATKTYVGSILVQHQVNDYAKYGNKYLLRSSWRTLEGNQLVLDKYFTDLDANLGLFKTIKRAEYGNFNTISNYSFFPDVNIEYNDYMQITSQESSDYISTSSYDDFGRKLSDTDVNDQKTAYTYDNRHRIDSISTMKKKQVMLHEYTSYPPSTKVTTEFLDGTPTQWTKSTTDGWGNPLTVERSDGATLSSTTYDNLFRVISQSKLGSGTTDIEYEFSPLGRKNKVTDANGNVVQYHYLNATQNSQDIPQIIAFESYAPNHGMRITLNDKFTEHIWYDANNKEVIKVSGEKGVTKLRYDKKGRLTGIENPIKEIYSIKYNQHTGMLASKKVPNKSTEYVAYDKRYNLIAMQNSYGQVTSADYDDSNKLNWTATSTNIDLSNAASMFPYEVDGINSSVKDTLSTMTYLQNKTWIDKAKTFILGKQDNIIGDIQETFLYDEFGRVKKVKKEYDTGQKVVVEVDNIYNDANLAKSSTSNISGALAPYTMEYEYEFDPLLRMKKTYLTSPQAGKHVVEEIKYTGEDQVKIKYVGGDKNSFIQAVDYKYDVGGRLTQINDPNTTKCFAKKKLCNFTARDFRYYGRFGFAAVKINGILYNFENIIILKHPNPIETLTKVINDKLIELGFLGSIKIKYNLEFRKNYFYFSLMGSDIESFEIICIAYPNKASFNIPFTKQYCCERTVFGTGYGSDLVKGDLFFESIDYDGINIGQIQTGANCGFGLLSTEYKYDKDHRIISSTADLMHNTTSYDAFSTSYSYDVAGNIKTLNRNGYINDELGFGLIDSMKYSYAPESSLLSSVEDLVTNSIAQKKGFGKINNTSSYGFDGAGNIIGDSEAGLLTAQYNRLNLANVFTRDQDSTIYTYSAANELLITEHIDTNKTIVYKQFGPFQFRNDTIDHITMPNGRLAFDSKHSTFYEQYVLTDHLGNVVVTFSDKNGDKELLEELSDFTENNEVFQRMVYYPFGMDIAHPALQDTIVPDQRLRYNGKESQKKFKIPYLNYHARMYDAAIGRFTGVDPLADKMPAWSPYSYTFNNPIRFIDPDGRAPTEWPPKWWSDYRAYADGLKNWIRVMEGREPTYTEIFMTEVEAITSDFGRSILDEVPVVGEMASIYEGDIAGLFIGIIPFGRKFDNLIPRGLKDFKIKDSDKNFDYEVRGHKADPDAPAGSNSANGPTVRVSRKSKSRDANGQGSGTEYYDPVNDTWHHESTLREKFRDGRINPNYNREAANNTHIPNNREE